ncbi:MAG: hypothetical protein WCB00_07540 [Candidatus Acidiferrales bacterium]
MGQLNGSDSATNVNVTLGPKSDESLAGKSFPCCVCSENLEIRLSKNEKPYCTCLHCGIQIFFRGKTGIRRLTEILHSDKLAVGNTLEAVPAVILFNRISQMRSQKKELEAKQGLIMRDTDLDNAIRAIECEMKGVQRELEVLARKTGRESKK